MLETGAPEQASKKSHSGNFSINCFFRDVCWSQVNSYWASESQPVNKK